VVKKRSASKERESKCNESRRISKPRSSGSSCWNTPGPEVRGGYGSKVLILDSLEEVEERKVLCARGVYSSEERLVQKLSMLSPKPRFSTASESKMDANDAGLVSFPRVGKPSSVFVGVSRPDVVQTDVTDEGVQEAERRVGVVQLESSKDREECVEEVGDEK